MKTNKILTLVIIASCLFIGCSKRPAPKSAEQNMSPAMTLQQMEEAFAKSSTPGVEHKLLASMVGSWNAKVSMWMDPSKPPQVSKGHTVNTLVYGGRFVEMKYNGDWMGQKFEGTGLWGYDTIGKQYQSTWHDSMGTQIMTSAGKYDPTTNSLTLSSTESCPMTGGPVNVREVVTMVDQNKHIFETFRAMPDGSEAKAMEIVYTREHSCKGCEHKKCKKCKKNKKK